MIDAILNSKHQAICMAVTTLLLCGCLNFDMAEVDTGPEAPDSSTQSDNDTGSQHALRDSDVNSDADSDTDSDADSDTDSDSDSDSDTDTDADSDTDTDADSDTDSSSETHTDSHTEVDTRTDDSSDTHSDYLQGTDTGSIMDTLTIDSADTESENPRDTTFGVDTTTDANVDSVTDTFGGGFDARPTVVPTITDTGGEGNVTAVGNVLEPETSAGGACNYGNTEVLSYALINVNVLSQDKQGQWQDGKICGECAKVTVQTAQGDESTVVRIMDRCSDDICGIGVGGYAAKELMGDFPGKYFGSWEFVPCSEGVLVSDGPPAIYVKDGSSSGWALIQIRNPPAAVQSIEWEISPGIYEPFDYAINLAENFFLVPQAVRESSAAINLKLTFSFQQSITISIVGNQLTVAESLIELPLPD